MQSYPLLHRPISGLRPAIHVLHKAYISLSRYEARCWPKFLWLQTLLGGKIHGTTPASCFFVFFPGRISGFSNMIGFCMFSYFQGYSSFIRSSYLFCHEWGNVLPIPCLCRVFKTSHGNSKDEVNRLSQLNMIHNQWPRSYFRPQYSMDQDKDPSCHFLGPHKGWGWFIATSADSWQMITRNGGRSHVKKITMSANMKAYTVDVFPLGLWWQSQQPTIDPKPSNRLLSVFPQWTDFHWIGYNSFMGTPHFQGKNPFAFESSFTSLLYIIYIYINIYTPIRNHNYFTYCGCLRNPALVHC